MTKRGPAIAVVVRVSRAARAACAALAVLLLAATPAAAHGAPPARELDARVLADDEGLAPYGGGGLDLLALDVREAWLVDEPAAVFRFVYQSDAPPAGRSIHLAFAAGGQDVAMSLSTADGLAFVSPDFARVDAPADVGDGHPKALDAWVTLAALGVAPGDELAGVTVRSADGESPDDDMPGGWYLQGQEVPHLPHEPDPGEALAPPGPGTYTLKGPQALLEATADAALVDLARAASANVTLRNPLAALPQFARVALQAPPGVVAALAGADADGTLNLSLDPGASRTVTVAFAAGSASGNVTIVARSDLGARAPATLQVVAPPPAPAPVVDAPQPSAEAKDTPAIAGAWLAAPLLGVAWALRRRGGPAP